MNKVVIRGLNRVVAFVELDNMESGINHGQRHIITKAGYIETDLT